MGVRCELLIGGFRERLRHLIPWTLAMTTLRPGSPLQSEIPSLLFKRYGTSRVSFSYFDISETTCRFSTIHTGSDDGVAHLWPSIFSLSFSGLVYCIPTPSLANFRTAKACTGNRWHVKRFSRRMRGRLSVPWEIDGGER